MTVTRIVSGELRVAEARGEEAVEPSWTFYGDERLDEVVALRAEHPRVVRRQPSVSGKESRTQIEKRGVPDERR
jgi:hypothetical protein